MNEDPNAVSTAHNQNEDSQSALSYPSPQNTRYSRTKQEKGEKFEMPICWLSMFKHVFARHISPTRASQFFISALDNDDIGFRCSQIGSTRQGHQKTPEE